MFKKILFPLIALGLIVNFAASAQNYGTRDEAVALTKKAQAFMQSNSKESLIAELNNKEGQFIDRDMYVMAANVEDGNRLAHPYNQNLLGRSVYDAKDIDGKAYGEEIMEIAMSGGEGWVSYKFTNPKSGVIEEKETYILTVGDMILYCGIYKQ